MRRAWFIEVEVFRMIEAGRAKSRGFFRHSAQPTWRDGVS
jgi:hypothetical protein